MSRALDLFCCHYLLSPCSGPSTSVSFRLTRLSPLHSHTQLSLCDVSLLLLLLLFISRCLPALLVLAFYETFQKIAFMMLLLTLSLFCLHFRCFTPFRCVLVNPSTFSIVLSFACGDGGVVGFFVFVPAPVYWCDPRGFVLHGLRKNLTNFSSVFTFCFLPKLCIFCVLCFCLSVCV